MTHQSSRWLALITLGVLLVLYGLTTAGLMGPNPVGQTGQDVSPLVVPESYAFAIWGPIYLGLIAFPIFQFFKKREEHPEWISFRRWYALNVVANGLWLVVASYDWYILTVLIIVFMLYTLVRLRSITERLRAAGVPYNYWAEGLVFSMYFAWITLATALNVTTALDYYGVSGIGPAVTLSAAVLLVAAGIAYFVARRFRDAAYAGVVVWAFVALVVRHWGEYPLLAYLSLGVAVLFSILLVRYVTTYDV